MKPYYEADGITIYHGDWREVDEWRAADVVVSDPPYGIAYQYSNFRRRGNDREVQTVIGDGAPFDPSPFLGQPCVLWGANYYAPALPPGKWLVWNKRDYREAAPMSADAEMAWHNLGTGPPVAVFNWFWIGYFRKGETGKPKYHPSQKPVSLMEWCIHACPAGTVADPFMGSGSTLVAARNLGREAIGVEVEERYCEIAVKRLAQGVLDLGGSA